MRLVLSSLAAILLSGTALAADSFEGSAGHDWSGFYVGVNAGYAGGNMHYTYFDTGVLSYVYTRDGDGALFGVQAGYNWQSGALVFGVETDLQYTNLTSADRYIGESYGEKVQWFGTTRARLGYTPMDRLLIYGTGGFAYGEYKVFSSDPNDYWNTSTTRTGWTAGAGLEVAVNDRISVKGEYLYTHLGTWTVYDDGWDVEKIKLPFHAVRIGMNFKF